MQEPTYILRFKFALLISLLVCAVFSSCATTERIVTDGEQQYQELETTFLGFRVKKTRKPILSAMQQALEDLRQQKLKTQAMYRKVALFCALGAVGLLVAGYLTKYSEATGAAAILGGSSLICAWLSVAVGLWWLVLIAVVLLVAVYLACKVRGFHAPEVIKNKIKRLKDARANRDVQSKK